MEKVRTIFFGTSNFALGVFKHIVHSPNIDLLAIVTQPDRPVGRKQKLTPPLLKEYVITNYDNLSILQPEKLRDSYQQILELKPELLIVADYGQMIPKEVLDYPKYKCINVHGSYLPDLRGAVPIPMAILKGYQMTGVSIIIMTEGLDNGPIIAQVKYPINSKDTTQTLTDKLADEGGKLLVENLESWFQGKIDLKEQDESKVTICKQSDIAKEKAKIDWSLSASEVERMIRAFNPWPIAWTTVMQNGVEKRLKIYKAKIATEHFDSGCITRKGDSLFISAQDNSLELLELQIEGKNIAESKDYLFLTDSKVI